MYGLGNISRMGEKTRIQSTTGTILHFLWFFFFPFFSPVSQPGFGVIQYTEVETGTDTVLEGAFEFWFKEKDSGFPMFRGRGNSCLFPLPVSGRPQWLCWQWGLAAQKPRGGGPFSLIRGAVVLRWPGKLLLFFFILPPLSPGCKGNCTEHVASR